MNLMTGEPLALRHAPRCGARNRQGKPCRRAVAKGKGRCRLHGGAPGSGAPRGVRNGSYKHGGYTVEAIEEARVLRAFVRQCREAVAGIT